MSTTTAAAAADTVAVVCVVYAPLLLMLLLLLSQQRQPTVTDDAGVFPPTFDVVAGAGHAVTTTHCFLPLLLPLLQLMLSPLLLSLS